MTFLPLALVLAASPVPQAKLAAPGISIVNMKPELSVFLTEHLAQAMSDNKVDVVTPKQIETILGLERQKELAGCSETGCAVELANALGVDALLIGEIGKLGEAIQVNLKVISPVNTKQLAAWSTRVNGEDQLFDALNTGARALALQLYPALGRETPPALIALAKPPEPEVSGLRRWSWIPAAVGAVTAAYGFYSVADAYAVKGQLEDKTLGYLPPADVQVLRARGEASQSTGWVCVGLGGAAVAAGVVMFLAGAPSAPVQASVVPLNGGGAVSLSGSFP